MLIRICTKLTENFVRKGILEHSLADWCIYWLQKRILTGLVVLAMFAVGSFAFGAEITACFLLGLLPLRRRLVGFHTDSPFSCILLSVGIVLLTLFLHSTFSEIVSLVFGIVNLIICTALVTFVLKDMPDSNFKKIKEDFIMKKLQKRPVSVWEKTFALATCGCASNCCCTSPCNCPIAPTHQIGLNVEGQGRTNIQTGNKAAERVNAVAYQSL